MLADDTMHPGGRRAAIVGALALLFVVAVAALLGALLGLQPLFIVPLVAPLVTVAVLWIGVKATRRAVGFESGWHAYLVLTFWVLTINLPAVVAFDPTGFTRANGLFNAQSIGRIVVFMIALVLALVYWLLWSRERPPRASSESVPGTALLLSLYVWYLVEAPMVTSGTPLALAGFRVAEWLLAFGLLHLCFRIQNTHGQTGIEDRLRIVMPMLFFLLGSVLVMLPIAPGYVYQVSTITGTGRLGGAFTHPNLLAIVAIILFAYGLGYWRGWKRAVLVVLSLVVLGFTYSRGGYAAFALVAVAGLLLLARHPGTRLALVLASALAALTITQAPQVTNRVADFLSRGNENESLATLSERTAVWEAARTLIARSPWLGDGFTSGPKRLGDEMIRARLSRNFAAVHAHNEFLQAQISGGLVAMALSLAIHLRVLFLLLFRARLERRAAFLMWSVVLSVIVWGVLTPSLSYLLTLPGVLLGWALLTLEGLARECRIQGRHAGEPA